MTEPQTQTLYLPARNGQTLAIDATPTGRGTGPGAWTITVYPLAVAVAGIAPDDLRRQAMAAIRAAFPGQTGTATISLAAG